MSNELETKIDAMAETLDELTATVVRMDATIAKFGALMDALGSNPMLGAMLPPEVYSQLNG